MKHVHQLRGKWRWIPPPWARALGAVSEQLTDDATLTDAAIARAAALTAWYAEARDEARDRGRRATPAPARGTLAWLIADYRASSWYGRLRPGTRAEAEAALALLEDVLGPAPVVDIGRRHVRAAVEAIAARRGDDAAVRAAKYLRRVFAWAIELELRADNPASRLGLARAAPRRQTWTARQVIAVARAALGQGRPSIALAVRLAYDTAARPIDLRLATWQQFDGEGVTIRATKTAGTTGTEVWVPVTAGTRRLLDAHRARRPDAVQILVDDRTGAPYARREAFAKHLRAAMAAAGVTGLQLRDLRRTAATEVLAGGGRAEPITGHAPGSPALRVYEVPNRTAARTAQAARKRNRKSNGGGSEV